MTQDLREGEYTATHTGPINWRHHALRVEKERDEALHKLGDEETQFRRRLVEEAKALLSRHFEATKPEWHYDVVNAGIVPWDNEKVVAVTIATRGRSTDYEVWEVCFTTDGAWEGVGSFGRVAHTVDEVDLEGRDPSGPDLQFDEFGYNLEIKYEVSETKVSND